MSDLEEFRQETRKWLEENCPPLMREPMKTEDDACWGGRNCVFQSDDQRIWLERMAARGWTTPTWPTQYGGGGLNAAEAKILQQEIRRINARRPLSSFGIDMLGPALLKFASEEQKQKLFTAASAGVRATANLIPAPTLQVSRPKPKTRATIMK